MYNNWMKVNLAEIGLSDNDLHITCSHEKHTCPECDDENEILGFHLARVQEGGESLRGGPDICWCACGCVWNPKSKHSWNIEEQGDE